MGGSWGGSQIYCQHTMNLPFDLTTRFVSGRRRRARSLLLTSLSSQMLKSQTVKSKFSTCIRQRGDNVDII